MKFVVDVTFFAISRPERPELWDHTFEILDGVIKVGRDEPVDALGAARLRAARLIASLQTFPAIPLDKTLKHPWDGARFL